MKNDISSRRGVSMEGEEIIKEILKDFRRSLQQDGGDIEFIGFEGGEVKVRITRTTVPVTFSTFLREYKTRTGIGCGRCQIPTSTIASALESALKEKMPGIKRVRVVK
jgi:Fe-S cluster biogenesis protein NfuA